jgi:hypothetical protein
MAVMTWQGEGGITGLVRGARRPAPVYGPVARRLHGYDWPIKRDASSLAHVPGQVGQVWKTTGSPLESASHAAWNVCTVSRRSKLASSAKHSASKIRSGAPLMREAMRSSASAAATTSAAELFQHIGDVHSLHRWIQAPGKAPRSPAF